jgi:hypothetical protein
MLTVNKCRWLGALFVLITVGGLVLAQQPGQPATKPTQADPFAQPNPGTGATPAAGAPQKLSLEDLISRALKENPDIRVGEAKVKEAEAELSRTRMTVAQKVIAFHASLVTTRKLVEEGEDRLKAITKLVANGTTSQKDLREAELSLTQAKAELARLEAELPYLLGQSPRTGKAEGTSADAAERLLYWRALEKAGAAYDHAFPVEKVAGSIADKVRKALDAPITLKANAKQIGDWLDFFKDKMGVSFLDMLPQEVKGQSVSLGLSEPVPTGAALQAFSDLTGLRFAVREYGILVTKGDLPPGSVPLHVFWKSGSAQEKASGQTTTPAPK